MGSVLGWTLLSCAPAPPPDAAWTLTLHGEPVGVVRVWDRPEPRWERTLRVLADGATRERRTALTGERGDDGALARWWGRRDGEEVAGAGPVWDPWVAPPLRSGSFPLLREDLTVAERAVRRDGDHLEWDTAGGIASVELLDGRPLRGTWAGVAFVPRGLDDPEPAPLDVARVLSRPAPALPRPRRSRVSEWLRDGEVVQVESPLAEEVPATLRPVGDLARQVAQALPDAAAPWGGPGGGDCTEHTALFLSEARHRGWDVRPAAGWLYVDTPEPRLWLHAWAEVRSGDRWIPVDPTLGTFPADAARLRLGETVDDVARADAADVTIRDLR